MNTYRKATPLLDYDHCAIQALIKERKWQDLDIADRIKEVYNFVRDEIKFGYNIADNRAASAILKDGYGQCNTKATLLMALLRAVGIQNRIHGFTIDKALQKGAITGIWYRFSPKKILHSWVEIEFEGVWYSLEGVILDKMYLSKLQEKFKDSTAFFCGYGVCTDNFINPVIDWNQKDTFIQNKGISSDFGLFDTPDDFYAKHQQKLNVIKRFIFRNIVRHQMNKNVENIRNGK